MLAERPEGRPERSGPLVVVVVKRGPSRGLNLTVALRTTPSRLPNTARPRDLLSSHSQKRKLRTNEVLPSLVTSLLLHARQLVLPLPK
jgi:hypothetical protein